MNAPTMNVLVIITDQHHADHVGFAGNPTISTPNLDSLAARGTVFENTWVTNPVCMPNRSTIMTSRMPSAHGVVFQRPIPRVGRRHPRSAVPSCRMRTALIGKSHLQHGMEAEESMSLVDLDPTVDHGYPAGWDSLEDPERYESAAPDFPDGFLRLRHRRVVDRPRRSACPDITCSGRSIKAPNTRTSWYRSPPTHPRFNVRSAGGRSTNPRVRRRIPQHQLRHRADDRLHRVMLVNWGNRGMRGLRSPTPTIPWPHQDNGTNSTTRPTSRCHDRSPTTTCSPTRLKYLRDTLKTEPRTQQRYVTPCGTDDPDLVREYLAATYGLVEYIDHGVGRILESIEAAGQTDNTIVVFTSDHGDMGGDHGLLLKGFQPVPRRAARAARHRRPPSFLQQERARLRGQHRHRPHPDGPVPGSTPYDGIQGLSLAPVLDDPAAAVRDHVLIEDDLRPNVAALRRMPSRLRTIVTVNTKYSRWGDGHELLFDINSDLDEFRDLAHLDDPMLATTREALMDALLAHTDDAQGAPVAPDATRL